MSVAGVGVGSPIARFLGIGPPKRRPSLSLRKLGWRRPRWSAAGARGLGFDPHPSPLWQCPVGGVFEVAHAGFGYAAWFGFLLRPDLLIVVTGAWDRGGAEKTG